MLFDYFWYIETTGYYVAFGLTISQGRVKNMFCTLLVYYNFDIESLYLNLVDLTPLIPLSLVRRGGKHFREGAKPPP